MESSTYVVKELRHTAMTLDTLIWRLSSSKLVILLFLLFFSFMFPSTCTGSIMTNRLTSGGNNCSNCRHLDLSKIEEFKRVAMIKATILKRLGIIKAPTVPPTQMPDKELGPVEENTSNANYELSDILSYSEAPDNFMDDNIVQFRLAQDKQGRELYVKSADLLIRVKFPRKKNRRVKKSNLRKIKRRRKHRKKFVDLVISTVNGGGKPDKVIASVKSQLRKTKWLRLNLPHTLVQEAVESRNGTLQVYIECEGCGPDAQLVLVHRPRKRKRKRLNTSSSSRRLNKRRPILFLHSKMRTEDRHRRSANSQSCSNATGGLCCKSAFVVDFESIGWQHWIVSPKRYKTAFCEGSCGTIRFDASSETNATGAPATTCVPTRWKNLRLVYYTAEGVLLQETLPNMVVTRCGCRAV